MLTADLSCGTRIIPDIGRSRSCAGFDVAWPSCLDTGMVFQEKTPFHQGAWVGDHFDLRLYNDLAEDMTLDGVG
jgi:hypothetical protein